MKVQAWREESVSKDNRKNDGEFSSENIDLASSIKRIKETMDIRVWTSGELLATCVIWCKGFPFWNLVPGVRRLIVEVIWGDDSIWIRQANRW